MLELMSKYEKNQFSIRKELIYLLDEFKSEIIGISVIKSSEYKINLILWI